LGLPSESAAKISDIKHAYLRIAMKHHPDKAGADNVESKEIFEEASEAYRTLMDPNQRYYYDRHGYPEMELRQGVPSIFDWEPSFDLYTRRQKYAEPNQGTQMEDFFSAQGYSRDEKLSWRQKIKNNYIEFKYGMKYYNFFDWQEWRRILGRFALSMSFMLVFVYLFQKMTDNLVTMPEYKKYLPIKLNETWKPEVQQELERKKNFYTSESLLEIRNKHPLHRRLTAAEHSGKNNLADGLTERLDKEKEIKRLVKRLNQLEAEAKEIRVKLRIIEYESKNSKNGESGSGSENSNHGKKKNNDVNSEKSQKLKSNTNQHKQNSTTSENVEIDLTEKSSKEKEIKKSVKLPNGQIGVLSTKVINEKNPDLKKPKLKQSENQSSESNDRKLIHSSESVV